MPTRIHIGTCGWSYPHWRPRFYPSGCPPSEWLAFYAGHFDAVELDQSFYRLPAAHSLALWRSSVPPGFIFAAKASRYITHLKKLLEPARTLAPFLSRIELLGSHLGPLLFQLPPHWRLDPGRLAAFLGALPASHRCVVEFRDRSWYADAVYGMLADHRVGLCLHDLTGCPSPLVTTSDLVYVRLHGSTGDYRGAYGDRALAEWAERLAGWAAEGRDVHCYFNNDEAAHAPHDALRLLALLERLAVRGSNG